MCALLLSWLMKVGVFVSVHNVGFVYIVFWPKFVSGNGCVLLLALVTIAPKKSVGLSNPAERFGVSIWGSLQLLRRISLLGLPRFGFGFGRRFQVVRILQVGLLNIHESRLF